MWVRERGGYLGADAVLAVLVALELADPLLELLDPPGGLVALGLALLGLLVLELARRAQLLVRRLDLTRAHISLGFLFSVDCLFLVGWFFFFMTEGCESSGGDFLFYA